MFICRKLLEKQNFAFCSSHGKPDTTQTSSKSPAHQNSAVKAPIDHFLNITGRLEIFSFLLVWNGRQSARSKSANGMNFFFVFKNHFYAKPPVVFLLTRFLLAAGVVPVA